MRCGRPMRGLLAFALVALTHRGAAQTTVTLTKAPNGQDVQISITGTGPFSIFRGAFPNLSVSAETLVDSQAGTAYTDMGAVQAAAPVYFYDIAGLGETSPATTGGGNPQAAVVLVMVSPNAGKAMDSITLTGSGFAQFFTENLVTFNGKPATVTAGSMTSLTVTVPQGATRGPIPFEHAALHGGACERFSESQRYRDESRELPPLRE